MKVALFGGTGFVGSYIIDELLANKHKPKLLVREGLRKEITSSRQVRGFSRRSE